jgi:hypothetical protein
VEDEPSKSESEDIAHMPDVAMGDRDVNKIVE